MFKKFVVPATIVTALVLVLTGCSGASGIFTEETPSADKPIVLNDSGYEVEHIKLDNSVIITCLEGGIMETRVVSCVIAGQDYTDAIPLADSEYSYEYINVGQGHTALCLEKGIMKTKVLACVPYEK